MSRVRGTLLDSTTPPAGVPCELELRRDVLVAHLPDGGEVALPLATLAFERRGFDHDLLAFYTAGTEHPWLTTRDPALLAALEQHPRAGHVLAQVRARRRRPWVRHALLPVALLLGALATIVWLVSGPLVGLALRATPTTVDTELGRVALPPALAQVGGKDALVTDARVVEPVRAMLAPLVAQVPPRQGYRFEVHVVRHEMVNAFALPGGPLVVTTGLLAKAPSAEAVTGVLAHEVAHVTQRHSVRSLLKQVGLWALLAMVFGDVSAASAILLEQAAALSQLSFSRDMELEADREGLALLAGAGLDLAGLRAFLETLQAEEQGRAPPEFLSTHPLTEGRIRALDRLIAERPPGGAPSRSLGVDFEALKAALREGGEGR